MLEAMVLKKTEGLCIIAKFLFCLINTKAAFFGQKIISFGSFQKGNEFTKNTCVQRCHGLIDFLDPIRSSSCDEAQEPGQGFERITRTNSHRRHRVQHPARYFLPRRGTRHCHKSRHSDAGHISERGAHPRFTAIDHQHRMAALGQFKSDRGADNSRTYNNCLVGDVSHSIISLYPDALTARTHSFRRSVYSELGSLQLPAGR